MKDSNIVGIYIGINILVRNEKSIDWKINEVVYFFKWLLYVVELVNVN